MGILLFSLIFLTIIYVVSVLFLIFGLILLVLKRKNKNSYYNDSPFKSDEYPSVSVVIPVRDEEKYISRCLDSLIVQDYPSGKYDVIVVDDCSTDKTVSIVKEYSEKYPFIKLILSDNISSGLVGKKKALDIGIRATNSEIILTTDADTVVKEHWILGMVRCFKPDVGYVVGFVNYNYRNFFQTLVALEKLSTMIISAGGIGIGVPIVCIGSNRGFRRSVFFEVGGFEKIKHSISGDDDLFMQLIDRETKWKIHFSISDGTYVNAEMPDNLSSFTNQRKRHLSATPHYTIHFVVLAGIVYVFDAILLFTIPFSIVNFSKFPFPIICFAIKSFTDFIALLIGGIIFRKMSVLKYFPIVELLHIPYIVIVGALSLVGKFEWKGREKS